MIRYRFCGHAYPSRRKPDRDGCNTSLADSYLLNLAAGTASDYLRIRIQTAQLLVPRLALQRIAGAEIQNQVGIGQSGVRAPTSSFTPSKLLGLHVSLTLYEARRMR